MLFQVKFPIIFLIAYIVTNARSELYQPKFCAECEEEVWQEVPCSSLEASSSNMVEPAVLPLSYNATPTSTTQAPITPTPTTTTTTTTAASSTTETTTIPPNQNSSGLPIEASEGYKKCYCECKSGCREFCRKVVLSPDPQKRILQISESSQPLSKGYAEIKHIHERNFIYPPVYSNSIPYGQNLLPQLQQPLQLAYVEPPSPEPASEPAYNCLGNAYDEDCRGISIDDVSKNLPPIPPYRNLIPDVPQFKYPVPIYVPQTAIVPPSSANTAENRGSKATAYASASQPNDINSRSRLSYAQKGPSDYGNLVESYPPTLAYTRQASSLPVKARTGSSDFRNAAAIAENLNSYKSSQSSSPKRKYVHSPSDIEINAILKTPQTAVRYQDTSAALKNLKKLEPSIDNYFRDYLYSDPAQIPGEYEFAL